MLSSDRERAAGLRSCPKADYYRKPRLPNAETAKLPEAKAAENRKLPNAETLGAQRLTASVILQGMRSIRRSSPF
jgi:hypothetical protein